MKLPTQSKWFHEAVPIQRSRECEHEQNRDFRRAAKHQKEGQRRKEMRKMYISIGKFALKHNDNAIQKTLLEKYRKYTRLVNPVSEGIKSAHAEMSAWYDQCRADYMAARDEDRLQQAAV